MTSTAVMSRSVNLLGRPRIDGKHGTHHMRSRKSWALLAYLLLCERPPTRSQLAALLFEEADDPLAALRWGLSEVRRALGGDATIEGDPVVLRLKPGIVVDVDVLASGVWADAVQLPALGSELLEGLTVRGAGVFESWLLSQQRRVTAASNEILHEAALASIARGDHKTAIGYAVRLVTMTPLDETGHALLIRLYRMVGDDIAARRQYATCARMLDAQLGTRPGAAVRAALRADRPLPPEAGPRSTGSDPSPTQPPARLRGLSDETATRNPPARRVLHNPGPGVLRIAGRRQLGSRRAADNGRLCTRS